MRLTEDERRELARIMNLLQEISQNVLTQLDNVDDEIDRRRLIEEYKKLLTAEHEFILKVMLQPAVPMRTCPICKGTGYV
jgi:hypothetical protein